MKGSALEVVLPLHLGLVDQEGLHEVDVVVHRGQVQRRPLLVRVTVHFGAIFDQDARSFEVADVSRVVQRRPPVRVDVVHVRVAVLDDSLECVGLVLLLGAQHGLVDRCLAKDAHPVVDLVAAVHQVPQVLRVRLGGGLVQVLYDAPRELIFADFERVLREGGRPRLGAEPDQGARGGRCAKVAGHVQR